MHAFVDGGFRNAELKALHFVRKFFQVVTLADIVIADGNTSLFKHMPELIVTAYRRISCGLKHQQKKKCLHRSLLCGKVLSTSDSSTNPPVSITEFQSEWNWEIGLTKT